MGRWEWTIVGSSAYMGMQRKFTARLAILKKMNTRFAKAACFLAVQALKTVFCKCRCEKKWGNKILQRQLG
jgi:hypothetical protein